MILKAASSLLFRNVSQTAETTQGESSAADEFVSLLKKLVSRANGSSSMEAEKSFDAKPAAALEKKEADKSTKESDAAPVYDADADHESEQNENCVLDEHVAAQAPQQAVYKPVEQSEKQLPEVQSESVSENAEANGAGSKVSEVKSEHGQNLLSTLAKAIEKEVSVAPNNQGQTATGKHKLDPELFQNSQGEITPEWGKAPAAVALSVKLQSSLSGDSAAILDTVTTDPVQFFAEWEERSGGLPMVAQKLIASAEKPGNGLSIGAFAAMAVGHPAGPILQLAKGSILERAIQEVTKESSTSSFLLTTEKSKANPAKEGGKAQSLNPRQEQIIFQIQKLMDQAALLRDGSSITLKVEPEELGQVTVKVTQKADQLFARIVPESKEVESTVRAGILEIVSHLVSAGFKAENIHVSIGSGAAESETVFSGEFSKFEGKNKAEEGEKNRHGFRQDNHMRSDLAERQGTNSEGLAGGWVA